MILKNTLLLPPLCAAWIGSFGPMGCSDSTGDETADASTDAGAGTETSAVIDSAASTDIPGTDQVTPQGSDATMDAWFKKGDYKAWKCEPAVHDQTGSSPHGKVRVCSNTLLSGSTGSGEYPVGAATVKELYDSAGTTILGYASGLKIAAGTGPETWYWFDRPSTSVAFNGKGSVGNFCVACHSKAPRDHIFIQVK